MANEQQVIDILQKGIGKYANFYNKEERKVQIMFRLNTQNKIDYITCIEFNMKNSIQLKDIIGANIYNFKVHSHIEEVLKRFAKELNVENGISLIASINEEKNISLWLFQGLEKIRQVRSDELK